MCDIQKNSLNRNGSKSTWQTYIETLIQQEVDCVCIAVQNEDTPHPQTVQTPIEMQNAEYHANQHQQDMFRLHTLFNSLNINTVDRVLKLHRPACKGTTCFTRTRNTSHINSNSNNGGKRVLTPSSSPERTPSAAVTVIATPQMLTLKSSRLDHMANFSIPDDFFHQITPEEAFYSGNESAAIPNSCSKIREKYNTKHQLVQAAETCRQIPNLELTLSEQAMYS